MCYEPNAELVRVRVPADCSHTGKARWALKPVDRCLAQLVRALNAGGVYTRSCCCGHGRGLPSVSLHDYSELVVLPPVVARRLCAFVGNPYMQMAVLVIASYGLWSDLPPNWVGFDEENDQTAGGMRSTRAGGGSTHTTELG